jgi:enoyl-CoA hydratase
MMQTVRVERAGPVVTVILDRPEVRNAVDRPTAEALSDAFRAFEADSSAAVAVLWGAGGTFCAGADLKSFAASDNNRGDNNHGDNNQGDNNQGDNNQGDNNQGDNNQGDNNQGDNNGGNDNRGNGNRVAPDGDGPMGPSRMALSKPVIAAVAGHAVAGGLELALWCDLRVVEEDAVLGVFCRRWGVPLIDGGTVRLPRIVGLGRALDLILTGRPVDAAEAYRIGLADRVVPRAGARAAAEALAAEIARFPQECLRNDRMSAYESLGRPTDEALAIEYRHGMASLAAGAREGAARFAAGEGRHGAF